MARACTICGSRRWRRDKVTGNAVCEEGHVYQDFRSENLVVEGFNFHVQKRTLKRGPRTNKRQEHGRANQHHYHGTDAEYLRLQATQLLLRLQVQALSRLWALPDAFEMIVRDLWAYQLAISPLPPLPDPAHPILEPSPPPPPASQTEQDEGDINMTDSKSDHSSSTESEGEEEKEAESSSSSSSSDDLDPALLEELEESDKEEGLREISASAHGEAKGKKERWRRRRKLRTADTLVTLVVGLWCLRIPFIYADIESLADEAQIPYLDFGRTELLPAEMRKHLNRHLIRVLSPQRSPNALALHNSARSFARALHLHFGVEIPESNVHPISWRIVASLGGTPTTYVQTMRLLTLLDINISLFEREIETMYRNSRSRTRPSDATDDSENEHAERADTNMEEYTRSVLYQDILPPELAIAAAWVIIMKIAFGLDDRPRQTLLKADPAIGLPDKKVWLDELKSRLESGVLRDQPSLENQDFTRMPEDELDAYLSKCQDVLLKDYTDIPDAAPFPLPPSQPSSKRLIHPNSWHTFHLLTPVLTHQPHVPAIGGENRSLPLMPGEKIRSYDSSDLTGILPEEYEVVLAAAAAVAGIEEEEVGKVVERFERRLEKIWANAPKSKSKSGKRAEGGVEEDNRRGNGLQSKLRPRARDQSQSQSLRRAASRLGVGNGGGSVSAPTSRSGSRAPMRAGSRSRSRTTDRRGGPRRAARAQAQEEQTATADAERGDGGEAEDEYVHQQDGESGSESDYYENEDRGIMTAGRRGRTGGSRSRSGSRSVSRARKLRHSKSFG